MSEEDKTVEEEVEFDAEDFRRRQLMSYGDIFEQLMKYERFQLFMGCNYELKVVQDDEAKEVRTVVFEQAPEEATANYNALAEPPKGSIIAPTAKETAQIKKARQ